MGCHDKTKPTSNGPLPDQVAEGVFPGQCDPVYGCPPPREVVCVLVEKVYDECKNSEVTEDELVYYADVENPVVDVECKKVKLLDGPTCEVIRPGKVRVTFSYRVIAKVLFEDNTYTTISESFTVVKNFNIPRAGEEGLNVQCQIPFLECLECFIKDEELVQTDGYMNVLRTTIACCVAKYLLIKLTAKVQLLIPAYGFCPEPPDCDEVLGECPDFIAPWPPYPPQTR